MRHRLSTCRALLVGLVCLMLALSVAACTTQSGAVPSQDESKEQTRPWNVRITNGRGEAIELDVPIARTASETERGLSGRTQLPEDGGMLFVFSEDVRIPFWMKDTFVPLSIAFIDEQGRIVDIQDMEPRSESLHFSASSFRYALEVNQGYFARRGIQKGDAAQLKLN